MLAALAANDAAAQAAAEAPVSARAKPPASAAEALDRAAAAYDFGDIRLMVDLARRVAEGALAGNDDQRAVALRLLGIGLYLDGRQDGAEKAFGELLALRPKTQLDPTVTRPEVVAFFKEIRRKNEPKKRMSFVFLPPLGQFQNDTPKRGWLLGGLEVATLGTAVATRIVLENWRQADGTCRGRADTGSCDALKLANMISVGALATTWVVGVIDAWVNHGGSSTEVAGVDWVEAQLVLLPGGAGLHLRF